MQQAIAQGLCTPVLQQQSCWWERFQSQVFMYVSRCLHDKHQEIRLMLLCSQYSFCSKIAR